MASWSCVRRQPSYMRSSGSSIRSWTPRKREPFEGTVFTEVCQGLDSWLVSASFGEFMDVIERLKPVLAACESWRFEACPWIQGKGDTSWMETKMRKVEQAILHAEAMQHVGEQIMKYLGQITHEKIEPKKQQIAESVSCLRVVCDNIDLIKKVVSCSVVSELFFSKEGDALKNDLQGAKLYVTTKLKFPWASMPAKLQEKVGCPEPTDDTHASPKPAKKARTLKIKPTKATTAAEPTGASNNCQVDEVINLTDVDDCKKPSRSNIGNCEAPENR